MNDLLMAVLSSFGFTILTAAGYYIHDKVFNREVDDLVDDPGDDDLSTSVAIVPVPPPSVPAAPPTIIDIGGAWEMVDSDSEFEDVQLWSPGRQRVRRVNSKKAWKIHARRFA